MLALIVAVVSAMFVIMTAFPLVMTLKRLQAEGVWMPFGVRVVGRLWALVGLPADAVYNLACGTWQFREAPKELLFSHRVQRLVRSSSEWRREKALRWAGFLNACDPGHIKL